MNTYLISIIIPCFNQAQFLEECCNSIINQKFQNWEAIIINDGSTDNTREIAKKMCAKDIRFNYHYQKNKGLSAARNKGLEVCNGDFIQFLDADDKLLKEKFYESIELYKKNKSDIIICDFLRFKSKNGKEKKARFHLKEFEINFKNVLLLWDIKFAIPIHCAIFNSNSISNIKFDESLKAKEDWLFWLQVLKNKPSVFFYNKKQALYRAHKNNMSKDLKSMFNNHQKANLTIYNTLSDKEKELFFERINTELFNNKFLFLSFKKNTFSRKFLRWFFFRN